MKKKNENYDWRERLCKQVQQSFLSSLFEIVPYTEFERNKEIMDISAREDEFEYNILASDVIMIHRPTSKVNGDRLTYFSLIADDLDDDLISEESFCSSDRKIGISAKAVNIKKFNESFLKMMSIVCDLDYAIDMFMTLVYETPFPYPSYTMEELTDQFIKLAEYVFDNKEYKEKEDKIIKYFHNSIYSTPVDSSHPSPVDAWSNDELMRKCIINRLMYKPWIFPGILRDGLNISKIAPRPSIFTTVQAIDLINAYSEPGDTIYDPFIGFGSKVLAAIIIGDREYCGHCPSTPESNLMAYYETINMMKWVAANFGAIGANVKFDSPKYQARSMCNNKNTVVMCEINPMMCYPEETHADRTDKFIDSITAVFDKCKRYVFIAKDTNKYKKYITEVDKHYTHLYDYTTNVIVINK